MKEVVSATRLVVVAAAHGLADAASFADEHPPTTREFELALDEAREQRIVGLLVAAMEAGALPATNQQLATAREAHEQALAVDLLLERRLVEVSRVFGKLGIEHRALKGPVVARTIYADPSLRSFGDVDILVDGGRFDDAIATLESLGGKRRFQEPRPGFVSRFGKGVCVVSSDGIEVDVHRSLCSGAFGMAIDTSELFRVPSEIEIGAAPIPSLGLHGQMLHACYHAALGSPTPRLSALRDLAELSNQIRDPYPVLETASHWRGLAVVQRALNLTRTILPARFDGALFDFAARYRPTAFERLSLPAYVSDRASYAAQAAAGVWALRGVRERAGYLQAVLFPSRDYLRSRDRSYIRRWRRAVGLVFRWTKQPTVR